MRVFIRSFEISDYVLVNKWRNDPEVTSFLGCNVFLVSLEREKKSIENKIFDDTKNVYFAICDVKSQKFIGYSSINNIDLRNLKAEWGGTLIGDKEFWGKGLGREASAMVLRFLFDQYPINKCYGYCLEEHPYTPKLLSIFGFKKDGILREDIYKNGEFKNVLLYSILRNEIDGQF